MTQQVDFSVSLPSAPVAPGDHVILNMQLVNSGTEALYVNARFAVVPQIGDVWLAVRLGDREVPFRFRVRLAALKNSDFLLLQPGERVMAGFHLTHAYSLDRAGTYEINAEYVSHEVPEALAGKPVYLGRARAAPARLTVR